MNTIREGWIVTSNSLVYFYGIKGNCNNELSVLKNINERNTQEIYTRKIFRASLEEKPQPRFPYDSHYLG